MSRTKKPCPGCGEVVWDRKPDEVCKHCRRILDKAVEERDFLNASENKVVIGYAERDYWNAHIHSRGKFGDVLRSKFFELVKSITLPLPTFEKPEFFLMGKMSSYYPVVGVMARPTAEAMRDLYALINPALEAEYEAGKKDGHNLLMRLAQGDLSPNEFMDKTED